LTTESNIRVRFAPSPTGNLHIGGARTAIYNWAFAKQHNGKFILRIEDTDPERSTLENTTQIIRSLRWLGLNWDEGPEVGGDFGPYQQTQRSETYKELLKQMMESDHVYPCFCSPKELNAKREIACAAKQNYGYDRCCRLISTDEAQARIAAGEPHTWRLKIPLNRGDITFDDAVYGSITVPISELDDFIMVRSDGTPTYNFVVCADDYLMQISHVIRGDDHLSNTPKQILVYEALGATVPVFAHLSMILGSDGKRLSKRHGATSVEAYRDAGYLSDALVNYLSLLGWAPDGETTIFSREQLKTAFDLERVSKNPAVFDANKLNWINRDYMKEMSAEAFLDALAPWLTESELLHNLPLAPKSTDDIYAKRSWYLQLQPLIVERIQTFADAAPMIAYLFSGPEVTLDKNSVEKCLRVADANKFLQIAIETLASINDSKLAWTHENIEAALRSIPEHLAVKPKLVFQAIRVAICGNMVSPPLFESIALIGRDFTLARLEVAKEYTLLA
jgi:glutamyl-tRNA synthetase